MPDENELLEKEEGLPEGEFTALQQRDSAFAPLLKGFLSSPDTGGGAPPPHKSHCARREALLLSLKPYLSPERCEAVDYLVRLARVGDAIRSSK